MTNMVQVSKVAIRALDGIFRNDKVDQPQPKHRTNYFYFWIDSRNKIVSAAAKEDSKSSSSFIMNTQIKD